MTVVHEEAAVHIEEAPHSAAPSQEAPPARSPAATVELLRASLRKETVPASAVDTVPAPAPAAAPETRTVHLPPEFTDEQEATELRLWAAGIPANRKHHAWIWVSAAALVVAAVVAFLFRDAWWPRHAAPPAAPSALQLTVASEDDGLISLHWNNQSAAVVQAREGRLQIIEGDKAPRNISMKPAQLAAGHLFYESTADRVGFQLEITEKSGTVVEESVIAAKKPEPTAPAPSQTPPQTPAQASAPTPAATSAVPAPVTNAPPAQPPATGAPAPRTFTPPPTHASPPRSGEGRVILMEPAPSINGGSSVPAGSMLPARVDIIPPPPAPKQSSAPPSPAPKRVQVGGRLQGAMLLRKVDPVYPQLARQMRIEGTVRFQAVIGKEGEVRDLKYVNGPQALEKAAADAVKQWVYRPTLLDGRPVEVSTQIEISFTLSR